MLSAEEPIPPGKAALLILGMHRSGTSAITGVLHPLGVQLGSRLFAPQAGVNEKGFWEHSDVVAANDDILRLMGSYWDDFLPILTEQWRIPELLSQEKRLAHYLQRDFRHAQLWAVKDPRICRLLPLWLRVLDQQGVNSRFLFVVRHPAEVAASLARRDQISYERSLLLWLAYNLEAERHTRNRQRAFALFDRLLSHPADTLQQVADTLELDFPVSIDKAMSSIEGFLTEQLRHHRHPPRTPITRIDHLAEDLYQNLCAVQCGENESTQQAFEAIHQRWEALLAELDPILVEALRESLRARGHYEKLFLDAYNAWPWKLSYPLRVIERWLKRF